MECIFCRIARGEIPAQVVAEDEHVLAFRDLDPRAPLHVLIIPRRHIASLNDVTAADRDVLGDLFVMAGRVAAQENVAEGGYRVVMNTGPDAGQSVHHAHLHLLGGRAFTWPPG